MMDRVTLSASPRFSPDTGPPVTQPYTLVAEVDAVT